MHDPIFFALYSSLSGSCNTSYNTRSISLVFIPCNVLPRNFYSNIMDRFLLRLTLFLYLCAFLCQESLAVVPDFHGNFQVVNGNSEIKGMRTWTLQNCLHRCQLHETCAFINFRDDKAMDENCIFYGLRILEHANLNPSPSWHLYSIAIKREVHEKVSIYFNSRFLTNKKNQIK